MYLLTSFIRTMSMLFLLAFNGIWSSARQYNATKTSESKSCLHSTVHNWTRKKSPTLSFLPYQTGVIRVVVLYGHFENEIRYKYLTYTVSEKALHICHDYDLYFL